jgi:hypothetical protein
MPLNIEATYSSLDATLPEPIPRFHFSLIVDLLLKVLRYLLKNFTKVNTILLRIDYLYDLGIKEGTKGKLNLFR